MDSDRPTVDKRALTELKTELATRSAIQLAALSSLFSATASERKPRINSLDFAIKGFEKIDADADRWKKLSSSCLSRIYKLFDEKPMTKGGRFERFKVSQQVGVAAALQTAFSSVFAYALLRFTKITRTHPYIFPSLVVLIFMSSTFFTRARSEYFQLSKVYNLDESTPGYAEADELFKECIFTDPAMISHYVKSQKTIRAENAYNVFRKVENIEKLKRK